MELLSATLKILQVLLEAMLPYIPLLVIGGWVITYYFKIQEEKRSAKVRAYENTLNVLWNLLTKAGDGTLTNETLYSEQGRCTDLELFASSEITYEVSKATHLIIELHQADLEKKNKAQISVNNQYEKIVNLMRIDLKLELGTIDRPVSIHDSGVKK